MSEDKRNPSLAMAVGVPAEALYRAPFSVGDVRRGYSWLGHGGGWTEVTMLSPSYRPGDTAWNRSHDAFPLTRYVRGSKPLLEIVLQYGGSRMVCYGLNPRPDALSRDDGRPRSAREADIIASQNLLVDIDLEGTVTPGRTAALVRWLDKADEYFTGLGINRPVRAGTGRGSHLLFAYDPISVADVPDLRERLRQYKNDFARAVRQDLSRLEAKVDSTQDLRRMTRLYGTSKPSVGIVSRFYGKQRVPDDRLRDYLLQLPAAAPSVVIAPDLTISDVIPEWFPRLLETDHVLADLWHGKGKTSGDRSTSGYDYTIAQRLTKHATDDELATIISQRPNGKNERARKGIDYLQRTVASARRRTER